MTKKARVVKRFTKEDDIIITNCVLELGERMGFEKAMIMLNRNKRQVSERYKHFLKAKTNFTTSELRKIIELKNHGLSFLKISQEFPGSTCISVRIAYKHAILLDSKGLLDLHPDQSDICVLDKINTRQGKDDIESLFFEGYDAELLKIYFNEDFRI